MVLIFLGVEEEVVDLLIFRLPIVFMAKLNKILQELILFRVIKILLELWIGHSVSTLPILVLSAIK